MSFLVGLLIVVEVVCALLLVLLILLQRAKDEGLGMAFGNAMGESLFGAQAATILTKATIYLAIVFMVDTVVLDRLYSRVATRSSSGIMDRLSEPAAAPIPFDQPAAPAAEPAVAPAAPAADAPAFVPNSAPVVPAAEQPVVPAAAPAPAPAAPVTPAVPAP
jgi:preprotein translocase subunit SecG